MRLQWIFIVLLATLTGCVNAQTALTMFRTADLIKVAQEQQKLAAQENLEDLAEADDFIEFAVMQDLTRQLVEAKGDPAKTQELMQKYNQFVKQQWERRQVAKERFNIQVQNADDMISSALKLENVGSSMMTLADEQDRLFASITQAMKEAQAVRQENAAITRSQRQQRRLELLEQTRQAFQAAE